MKKKALTFCAFLLIGCMVAGILSACKPNTENTSESWVSSDDENNSSAIDESAGSTDSIDSADSISPADSTDSSEGLSDSGITSSPESTSKTDSIAGTSFETSSGSISENPFDITTAPMPTRTLSNKALTYYSWVTLDQIYGATPKSVPALFKKEFGVTFKGSFSSHDTYWDVLTTLKASGNSPDLVMLPNYKFFPLAIVEDLIQPLDGLIDFGNPIWNDTKLIRSKCQWDGKIYIPFMSESINIWMFYNKKMFKDNGVKTPRQYYLENNWTWDVMKTLANQFVHKGSDGKVDTWGVGFQTNDLVATTGIELVETDATNGYKFNLRDPKIAKMMNLLYELGEGGSGALADGNGMNYFKQGKLAMMATNVWAANVDFNTLRLAGNLDWVVMPKMDKSSSYYHESSFDPGWGIVTGAKNPQAAALFLEYLKWITLGSPVSSYLPVPKNAAQIKYKSTQAAAPDPNTQFTQAEVEWTKTMIHYPMVSNLWQSWLGGQMVIPGYGYILTGAKQWSAALEEVYPVNDAVLKSYFK